MALPQTPRLTTDCVLFDERGRVLMVRRKNPPFEGQWALPGGFVDIGETVEEACRRELMEETGVAAGALVLTGVYSDPKRDARGHTCSVAFAGRVKACPVHAGDDAADAAFVADWRKEKIAFDHAGIIADAEAALSADGQRVTLMARRHGE